MIDIFSYAVDNSFHMNTGMVQKVEDYLLVRWKTVVQNLDPYISVP